MPETKIDITTLTVAIPSNGRPKSLRSCIESIHANISTKVLIYVLDSTPSDSPVETLESYNLIYSDFPDINRLNYDQSVPPGKARNILASKISTELILFLDDDLEIYPNALDKMIYALKSYNYDIISGVWLEYEKKRPIGFLYTEQHAENELKLLKCAVAAESVKDESITQFHDVQASLLVKSRIFNQVNFDERYDFFYELFDFFFQCEKKGIIVGAHSGAFFKHSPTPYESKSSRYYQNREQDKQRFIDKWQIIPEFARTLAIKQQPLLKRIIHVIKPS